MILRFVCPLFAALALGPAAVAAGGLPTDIELVTAVSSGIGSPIAVRHAGDGSGRLFIVGRYGRIWIRPGGGGAVLAAPFLNIEPLVSIAGEGGLLGLAFDPDYETNRRFYVSYTDLAHDSVIARYQASAGNPNLADPASATVILRIDQDSDYHKGGDLHFGNDGFLYLALGDGAEGSGRDDCNRAQSLTPADLAANDSDADCTPDAGFPGNPDSRALLGKLLRLNVSATTPAGANELCGANADGSAPYAIPPGNPYAGSAGGSGRCDEVFAYGLRNPFRFSVDRGNGDLYLGDVGETDMEEVDRVPAGSPGGLNFGWPQCEGTLGTCAGSVAPILVDDRSVNGDSCAITGGFRYRGAIASLQGTYVFSDYCSGQIRFARESGGTWSAQLWDTGGEFQHTSFGEDEAGELYLTEINADRVLRFASAAPPNAIFGDGFED
jgi:glucose/arabinose dehydrogenase